MPDCAFSEFEGVEPVDVTTMEDKQLVECTTPQDSPTSTCKTELRLPRSSSNKTDEATSGNGEYFFFGKESLPLSSNQFSVFVALRDQVATLASVRLVHMQRP